MLARTKDNAVSHFGMLLLTLLLSLPFGGTWAPAALAAEAPPNPAFRTMFQPPAVNKTWKEECSSCHIPFPPGLLQAESWKTIMSNLGKHFGMNATLGQKEVNEITAYLVANASGRWRYTPPPARISDAVWFKERHSEHVSAWTHPTVKTPANCAGCHKFSEIGDFVSGGGGCGGVCHTF